MPIVKFDSINAPLREMTFLVDDVAVVRRIPAQFEGSLDDFLLSHARNLATEFPNGVALVNGKQKPEPAPERDLAVEVTKFRLGDVVVSAVSIMDVAP